MTFEDLKCPCGQKQNSYFSLDFKTMLTKHYVIQVLSLDLKKALVYSNWDLLSYLNGLPLLTLSS